ncbi:MAG TPA: tyrosine-type recombinase/integrase [Phycisphaerae bacterium]|nr:tyrosine-type recombinase/integrase [Phycisphaerae bacterium]
MPTKRWNHIREALSEGRWDERRALLNNLNRRLATLRKRAGVAKFTYHDLRRSCITNWAQGLPAHVVQRLAGHSDIKTTQRYYLSVQEADLEQARRIQSRVPERSPTDPKLTQSGPNEGDRSGKENGQSHK